MAAVERCPTCGEALAGLQVLRRIRFMVPEQSADDRDRTAESRDRAAERRDRGADDRDLLARSAEREIAARSPSTRTASRSGPDGERERSADRGRGSARRRRVISSPGVTRRNTTGACSRASVASRTRLRDGVARRDDGREGAGAHRRHRARGPSCGRRATTGRTPPMIGKSRRMTGKRRFATAPSRPRRRSGPWRRWRR